MKKAISQCWRFVKLEEVITSLEKGLIHEPSSTDHFVHVFHECDETKGRGLALNLFHAYMQKERLRCYQSLGNYLVYMLVEVGCINNAHQVFDRVLVKSVDSWNTLISGYAQLGKYETVMNLCNRMIGQGVVPDIITFSLLLSVCSHTGLLDEGQTYFKTMMKIYGIIPSMQHHVSVVDLFGRSGQVDIAFTLITNVATSDDNISIWVPLLSACHKWGNVELASLVFKHMMQLNECHTASYVCMSNIYATLYNKSEKL